MTDALDEATTIEDLQASFDEVQARNAATIELLNESITELELALEDESWTRLVSGSELEFSRPGLDKLVRIARIMAIKNPLVRRAVRVQGLYVFGQGFTISGRDESTTAVIDRFVNDPGNRKVLFGQRAAQARNRTMLTDGNLFVRLFRSPLDGHVKLRRIPFTQVTDIIRDPNDAETPWFYRRAWTEGGRAVVEFYPDWRLRRDARTTTALPSGATVVWDTPVYHVSAGGLDDMAFGLPELYSSTDWARSYVAYLTDMATTARSLSRFAWKGSGGKVARRSMMSRLDTTLGDSGGGTETNPAPLPGSVASVPQGADLTPIPKTGMMLDADNGKPFRLMVASAVDLPDTILSGDPDQGNLATAKSLDRPTELAMRERQMLWADVYRDLCQIALVSDVRAPRGLMTGATVTRDPAWGMDLVQVDGEPAVIDVDFPPVLEQDVTESIEAIVKAEQAGLVPTDEAAKLAMLALGLDNVEELVDDMAADRDEAAASTAVAATDALAQATEALAEALR